MTNLRFCLCLWLLVITGTVNAQFVDLQKEILDLKSANYKFKIVDGIDKQNQELPILLAKKKVRVKGHVQSMDFENLRVLDLTKKDNKKILSRLTKIVVDHGGKKMFSSGFNSIFKIEEPLTYIKLHLPADKEDLLTLTLINVDEVIKPEKKIEQSPLIYEKELKTTPKKAKKLLPIDTIVTGRNLNAQVTVTRDVFQSGLEYKDNPYLSNLSFESKSKFINFNLRSWTDCGQTLFEHASPPDLHGDKKNMWGVTAKPSDGLTFVGLVVREDGSWESISQKLKQPLRADSIYYLSIDVSHNPDHLSGTINDTISTNFNTPTCLSISGSHDQCSNSEVLYLSPPITNTEWETLEIRFMPNQDFRYFILAANVCQAEESYNGNILIDNIKGPILEIRP